MNNELLECPICSFIMRSAVETTCGHAFCEFCIKKWIEKKPTCPACNNPNPQPVHPSFALRRIVEDFLSKNEHLRPQLDPNKEKELGNECYKNKQYSEAIAHYTEALSQDPDNHILYGNRAQVHIAMNNYSRALTDCDAAIRLCPIFVKGYIRKALCLKSMGRQDESLQTLYKALEKDKEKLFADTIRAEIASLQPANTFSSGGRTHTNTSTNTSTSTNTNANANANANASTNTNTSSSNTFNNNASHYSYDYSSSSSNSRYPSNQQFFNNFFTPSFSFDVPPQRQQQQQQQRYQPPPYNYYPPQQGGCPRQQEQQKNKKKSGCATQ